MRPPRDLKRFFSTTLVVLLVLGLGWKTSGGIAERTGATPSVRAVEGMLLGRMPPPVEPSIADRFMDAVSPETRYHLMTIRHIPPIDKKAAMPHPFVGECRNCHLFIQGPKPGSQRKTPVGALLERLSRVHKLGPPLRPTSQVPHPPAGRCIKCHDIVVKVPVERTKDGFRWGL